MPQAHLEGSEGGLLGWQGAYGLLNHCYGMLFVAALFPDSNAAMWNGGIHCCSASLESMRCVMFLRIFAIYSVRVRTCSETEHNKHLLMHNSR